MISDDNISNSYPLSRYSSFSNFEGDVEFLNGLCKSIRNRVKDIYKNSYIINDYRIFPDNGSKIILIDDSGVRYLDVENERLIGDDTYNHIPVRNAHTIVYIEDGKKHEMNLGIKLEESESNLSKDKTNSFELDER